MVKKSNTLFEIRPHDLNAAYQYSADEVAADMIPTFFRDLGRYMRRNPHMDLDDIRMSYMGSENNYLFEIHWTNNAELA